MPERLRQRCLEAGYSRVEYRDEIVRTDRLDGTTEGAPVKALVAFFDEGHEPNFHSGLAAIARLEGIGKGIGSAQAGYHRVLV